MTSSCQGFQMQAVACLGPTALTPSSAQGWKYQQKDQTIGRLQHAIANVQDDTQ